MRTKLILRFYFSAEKLERALNNVIMRKACASAKVSGDYCSAQIIEVINEKVRLARLWDCLYSIMRRFSQKELNVLGFYALSRSGISNYSEKEKKEVKRLTAKFLRWSKKEIEKLKTELNTLYRYSTLL